MTTFNGSTSNVSILTSNPEFWGLPSDVYTTGTPVHTDTEYREALSNGYTAIVTGSGFTYDTSESPYFWLDTGTLTHLTLRDNFGAVIYDVSGFSLTVTQIDTIMGNGGTWSDFLEQLLLNGSDIISGGSQSDYLEGFGGNDTITGGAGDDELHGGAGDDSLSGGADGVEGYNDLHGGAGNDTLDGTGGTSYAVYSDSAAGITANLVTGIVQDGLGGTDTLINIAGVGGSSHADLLTGNDADNEFAGEGGNDTINGGGGFDIVYYDMSATSGVNVNLATGIASDGTGGTDSLSGIEGADGSDYNDTMIGDANNNWLGGWRGNDTLIGAGGNDTLNGDIGYDTASYASAASGIVVDLALGQAISDGNGGTDTLTGIEAIIGSASSDYIAGQNYLVTGRLSDNLLAQTFTGGEGNDTLIGGNGSSVITIASYATSSNSVVAKLGTGSLAAGTYGGNVSTGIAGNTASDGFGGTDTLINIDALRGGSGNDTLVGGSLGTLFTGILFEQFEGGAGDDFIAGGVTTGVNTTDFDRVTYQNATAGVNVNFATGIATGNASVGTDTLVDINMVRGSRFNDTLTGGNVGNDGVETFDGSGGNDIIDGGTGFDRVDYRYSANSGVVVNFSSSTLTAGTNFGGIVLNTNVNAGSALDGEGGADTLTNVEGTYGSDFNDIFIGSDINNYNNFESFEGAAGNDYIDGRGGIDRADYFNGFDANGDGLGVVVNLGNTMALGGNWQGVNYGPTAAGRAVDSWGYTDTLLNMEQVRGSIYNDVIFGNEGNNILAGVAGHDLLSGGDGNDLLDGGDGNDNLDGGVGNDTIIAGAGNDWITSSLGDDSMDGGDGLDLVFYEQSSSAVTVNLQSGTASGAGIGIDQLSNIEAVHGSAFGDTVTLANTGGGYVFGRGGNDALNGGAGNDNLIGGSGNDTLAGGSGVDTANYQQDTFDNGGVAATGVGVTVNLATGIATDNWGHTDTLSGIENVLGSVYADSITGSDLAYTGLYRVHSAAQFFLGGAGNDTLTGGAANPTFTVVGYGSSTSTVVAKLGTGALAGDTYGGITTAGIAGNRAQDGLGGTDTLINVDMVQGGVGNDILVGGSQSMTFNGVLFEQFEGGAGNDFIAGGVTTGVNLADHDKVTYGNATAGVNVNLAAGSATGDASVGTDTLVDITMVRGSRFNDTLTGGNAGNNAFESFEGSAGNDIIDGGVGFDRVDFNTAATGIVVNLSNTALTASTYGGIVLGSTVAAHTAQDGENGIDTLANIEAIRGGDYADIMIGSDAPNYGSLETFEGLAGNDYIDGRGGIDRAVYSNGFDANADGLGVVANLGSTQLAAGTWQGVSYGAVNAGQAIDTYGSTDTLVNIEEIGGSIYNDVLVGSTGNNAFFGGAGNDWIDGGAGNDTLAGGAGADNLNGGNGIDTLDYSAATAAVTAELWRGQVTNDGTGAVDTFSGIENVIGGSGNDLLSGNVSANLLIGGTGNDNILGQEGDDTLVGGAGADTLNGGAGLDTLDYSTATAAVTAELWRGQVTSDGTGAVDTFSNIENVTGGSGNDLLSGNGLANVIIGGAGNDRLFGQEGDDTLIGGTGADAFNGGTGIDTADYSALSAAVTASLATGQATNDGSGAIDTFTAMENLIGGTGNDTLTGDTGANRLAGGAGADSLSGGDGNDTLIGGAGADNLNGGNGIDTLDYSAATAAVTAELWRGQVINDGTGSIDTFSGIENVIGGSGNDLLSGNVSANLVIGGAGNDNMFGQEGDDTLVGGAGADTLNGGAGIDTLDYSAATAAVTAELWRGQVTNDGTGAVDTFSNIENVTGGSGNDLLSGNGLANVIIGGAGNDRLFGQEGNDTLAGGLGNDSLTGGIGNDVFRFATTAEGIDSLADFTSGTDKIQVVAGNFGLTAGVAVTLLSGASTPGASGTGAQFLYNSTTGALFFDRDGTGNTYAAAQIATLTGPKTLTASDIQVVSA